jgi:hypothetical protein
MNQRSSPLIFYCPLKNEFSFLANLNGEVSLPLQKLNGFLLIDFFWSILFKKKNNNLGVEYLFKKKILILFSPLVLFLLGFG